MSAKYNGTGTFKITVLSNYTKSILVMVKIYKKSFLKVVKFSVLVIEVRRIQSVEEIEKFVTNGTQLGIHMVLSDLPLYYILRT